MKLAELLKVDTTKENWFKLLSKKGINPKTVSAVSKGGGGDGEAKVWYYRVDWDKLMTEYENGTIDSDVLEMLLMLPLGMSYSAIYPYDLGNTSSMHYDVDLPSPLLYTDIIQDPEKLVLNLTKIKAIKFKYDYSYPILAANTSTTYDIQIIYGDIYTKAYYMMNKAMSINEFKPFIDEYYTEISKQEYESLIERQNIILGKE